MKLWSVLALLAGLALAACAAGPTGIVSKGPPLIWLLVDGAPVEGYRGTYCWANGPTSGVCEDWLPPEFDSTYPLAAGEPIRLQFTPQPHWVSLTLGDDPSGQVLFTEMMRGAEILEWNVPAAPGAYILVVSAMWERQGGVTYLFSISVG